jgi:hypothetical protein
LIWEKSFSGWLLSKVFQFTWKKIDKVPDDQILLRAVTPNHLDDEGLIVFKFFQDKTGVSCNLKRFSTLEQARLGIGNPPERSTHSGLVSFSSNDVRGPQVSGDIRHDPSSQIDGRENYSHSLIFPSDGTKLKLSPSQARKLLEKIKIEVVCRR